MLVKCWWVLGWRNTITQSKMYGRDSTRPRGRSARELEGPRQPKQRTTEGAVFGLQKPTPAHTHSDTSQSSDQDISSATRWLWAGVREKAGCGTQKLEHPCHRIASPAPVPPAPALSSPLTPIPLFPEQVAEADARGTLPAPVRSTVNSHHRLAQGYIMKKWSRRQKEAVRSKVYSQQDQT